MWLKQIALRILKNVIFCTIIITNEPERVIVKSFFSSSECTTKGILKD